MCLESKLSESSRRCLPALPRLLRLDLLFETELVRDISVTPSLSTVRRVRKELRFKLLKTYQCCSLRSYQRCALGRVCTFLRAAREIIYHCQYTQTTHKNTSTHLALDCVCLSFASLPSSDAGLEGLALTGTLSPSCPRLMIFRGRTTGGGVLLVEALAEGTIRAKDGGTRQNGVRKMRTEPM